MFKIIKIVSKGDYNYAVVPDHPNRTKNNYVLEHRVVMENHIGRLLDSSEVVHHINGNKKDNRVENLEVMTALEHSLHHGEDRERQVSELVCTNCNKVFTRFTNQVNLGNKLGQFCSRSCNGKFINKNTDCSSYKINKAIPQEKIDEIKGLVADGFSVKEISKIAGISGNTVRKYMKYA